MPDGVITDEQVRFFRENGYLILRSAIHGEEFARLRNAMNRLTEFGKLGVHGEPDFLYEPGPRSGSRVLRRIEYVLDKADEAKVLLGHPYILRSVEKLAGKDFIPTWDSLVTKLPKEGIEVPWHRDADMKYMGDTPIFSVDFYLDPADVDTCLWILPGSHRWSTQDAERAVERPGFETMGAIPVLMQPGDVLFHNIFLLHGSKENVSSKTRRVVYFEFRTAHIEAEKGPHTPEYIPLKQQILLDCIARRKVAPYVSKEEVPYIYASPAPWNVEPPAEPLKSHRVPHEEFWRESG
jgi:ectoine hydroxylase-related dioxygenase (phytanoyl-CoA dioxygenase family)